MIYLEGRFIEPDKTKQKAALLGLAHQLYVQSLEDKGVSYTPSFATKYEGSLVEKITDTGILDEKGNPIFEKQGEFAIALNENGECYNQLSQSIKNVCSTMATLKANRWDIL